MILRALLSLVLAFTAQTSWAEVVTYTDAKGTVHYVEGANKVPEQFRGTINLKPKLGAITKSPNVLYKPSAASGTLAAKSGSRRVEVFVTSWCPYCKKLEKHLQDRGISYARYDIEKNPQGAKLLRSFSMGAGVPVTRIGTKIISGYNPAEIDAALR